ncbi:MAG: hypothetical protein C4B57_11905 [Deltaproteobacteria bacterium]|nr:MAG: hypothetical protein C4B57_11905 [Deltaproteobacteria bacterium]
MYFMYYGCLLSHTGSIWHWMERSECSPVTDTKKLTIFVTFPRIFHIRYRQQAPGRLLAIQLLPLV